MPIARITGTGGHVPPRVVTNDELATRYGIDTSDKWIRSRTGVRERRFAADGVGPADLAVPAVREALAQARLSKQDIDQIVFCTLSPEHAFPGSGVYLQAQLGLPDDGRFVPAIDVRNQCAGFLYGLQHAVAVVQSGMARHVLLVGAEVHSAALDLTTRGRTVASLFGDGAGAVVVSATDGPGRGVYRVLLGADGRHADALRQDVWDMRKRPFIPLDKAGRGVVKPEVMWAQMDGPFVFRHAVERMVEVLRSLCAAEGITPADIDLFLFHQANKRINQAVQRMLDLPDERIVHNIERYGNTTAATIPLLMAEAARDGKLTEGMTVAMVAFGSGFTWGGALMEW